MADPIIRVKRSTVSGKIPTTTQLGLGEIAINHYDGKIFIRKDTLGVGVETSVIVANAWSVGPGTSTYNTFFTAGNVGIGSTLPTSTLSVVGTGNFTGAVTAPAFNGQINAGVGTITTLFGTTLTYNTVNFTTANVVTGIVTNISGTSLNYSGIATVGSLSIGSTQVISSGRQLQNILSLDATTAATIENAITLAPNNFNDLQVTGISTFVNGPVLIGSGTSTGTATQRLQVTGGAYVSGNVGIATTNPQYNLDINGNINIRSNLYINGALVNLTSIDYGLITGAVDSFTDYGSIV